MSEPTIASLLETVERALTLSDAEKPTHDEAVSALRRIRQTCIVSQSSATRYYGTINDAIRVLTEHFFEVDPSGDLQFEDTGSAPGMLAQCVESVLAQHREDRQRAESSEATVESQARRIASLTEALRGLVDRLAVVHADERYKSVWMMYMIHGGNYSGPKYELELSVARAALAEPRGHEHRCDSEEKLRHKQEHPNG